MSLCPENLEKIFRQVEEDTARRVQEETAFASLKVLKLADGEDVSEPGSKEASLKVKARRRGSVSISRFGQLSDNLTQIINPAPTTGGLRRASSFAPYSTTYQNRSADSLASDNLSDEDAYTEHEHEVLQMHQIGGRQSTLSRAVSTLLPGRLGRSRSSTIVQPQDPSNMLIGVSVEEATVEHAPGSDEVPTGTISVVHSLRTLRSSTGLSRKTSLMDRARHVSQKLRRRSKLQPTQST